MSELFKFPYAFVRHDNTASTTQNSGFYKSAGNENRSAPLRNDHVILWAIDGLLALHAVLVRWRSAEEPFVHLPILMKNSFGMLDLRAATTRVIGRLRSSMILSFVT